MSERLAGVCFCKLDGDMIDLEGTITITPYMNTREPIVSSTGVIGYTETPRSPTVEITAYMTRKQLQALQQSTDMTVTAEMANGTVFVLSQAFVSGDPSVDAQAGTTQVTFSGVSGEFI
jgi:hypothetical protein